MKNQVIKAALFDLDGVVVFTDKYHYLAWKKLADENGWEFDENVNQRLRGIPRIASLEEIFKHNNIDLPSEEKERLANIKNEYYVKMLENLNSGDIFTGAPEFIKALRDRGIKVSLCSSSKNAEFVLNKLGLTSLFDAVVSGKDIVNAKPDPEVFLKGAEALGISRFNCAVFEDAKVGIEAARKAGMKAVGVKNKEETYELSHQFINDYTEIDVDTFIETGKIKKMPLCETALVEKNFDKKEINHLESLFALGNGYLGMRGTYDEPTAGEVCGMYINGVFATKQYNHLVKFKGYATKNEFTVNLPDWRIFTVTVDGESAAFSDNNISEHERRLEFDTGRLTRNFVFSTTSGKQVKIESIRLLNRKEVHGAEISYTVTPLNFSGEVQISSAIIKNTILRNQYNTETESESFTDNVYTIKQLIPTTGQHAAVSVAHTVKGNNYIVKDYNTPEKYTYCVNFALDKGETARVVKYAAFAGSIDGIENMTDYTESLARGNREKGFEFFLAEQVEFWKEHWEKADIKIEGSPADQQAVRYSLFQLKQQLATVNNCSIGATGLTGPGYSGQVFWDTEMYLMPYYNFTDPYSQKELLMYRYRILDKARARAKEFDLRGAMYAWCSIDGEETSVVYEASTAEYHLNSDIAYAVWRYVDSTGDKDFLYNYGAEIVLETAVFMSLRGKFVEARGGKFCINAVCGPDEYACGVNNNFYTNLTVKRHFEYAVSILDDMRKNAPDRLAKLLNKIGFTSEDEERIAKAAENMYLPYNDEYGIYMQDDSYLYEDPVDMTKIPMNVDLRGLYHPLDLWRLQVSKQADVCLATFLHGDFFDAYQKERCYDYYEKRCNHGSSLSPAIYSISAAELDRPEAYEFFRYTAYMDLYDFKGNTSNGIHIACNGGVWMSVINGFLGMRHYKDGLHFEPKIPKAWNKYSTDITYKGAVIGIEVSGEKAVFMLKEGNGISLNISGKEIKLTKEESTYSQQVK